MSDQAIGNTHRSMAQQVGDPTGASEPTDLRRRRLRLAAVAATVIVVSGAAAVTAAMLWQSTVDSALDRSVTLEHEGQAWDVSPRELGASPDIEAATATLRRTVTSGSWSELAMAGGSAVGDSELYLPLTAPDHEVVVSVAHLARRVDYPARDASIEVPPDPSAQEWEVLAARPGQRVDRIAARHQIVDALHSGADDVALPVDELDPAIPTEAAERALPEVQQGVEEALDRTVTLSYDDATWQVTPRDLEGVPEVEPAIETALDAATHDEPIDVTVAVNADRAQASALADDIADEVDRSRRDAEIDVGALEVSESRTGLEVDRDATIAAVVDGVASRADEVAVAVDEHAPDISTEVAEQTLPAVRAALEDEVTVVHGDRQWQVTPRDLGASADVEPALDVALDGGEPGADDVAVSVSDDSVAAFVDEVAGEVDRSPRHGGMDWSSGWIDVAEPRDGASVDRGAARERLAAALRGDADTVELPVERLAARSGDVPDRVLLLRQNDRRLHLYVDGEITHSWPVAVGQAGSPTPTGVFTVGAKRHSPTWTNPAPNGWGADMPARVGPGPGNPLGVRALNWNRGGSDTLIRFHGTPETSSIGQAASRGCVRLTNDNVRELYDLVPSGTKIVSLHG